MRKNLFMVRLPILLLSFVFYGAGWVNGQTYIENSESNPDSVSVLSFHFRIGSSLLLKDYISNNGSIRQLDHIFADSDQYKSLSQITIIGRSSMDGNVFNNTRLAKDRAEAIRNYLIWKYPALKNIKINVISHGEDWAGLKTLINSDPSFPDKEKVLSIINADINPEVKKYRIQQLYQGSAWSYLVKEHFRYLRTGSAGIELSWRETPSSDFESIDRSNRKTQDSVSVEKEIVRETPVDRLLLADTVSVGSEVIREAPIDKPVFIDPTIVFLSAEGKTDPKVDPYTVFSEERLIRPIALKSNLLYLLGSAVNIELEIPLARRWSLAVEIISPWWHSDKEQYALQLLWGNLEARYWFRPNFNKQDEKMNRHNPLSGWFIGAYGGGGYYDLEINKKGYQGEFFTAGLTGGYVLPLNRSFNMEFSLGVGYLQSGYRYYEAREDYNKEWHLVKQHPGRFTWIGPTRAKISLSWYPHIKTKKKGGNK